MTINRELSLFAFLPGATATALPLFATVLIPVWPLHRRLVELKQRELEKLDIRTNTLNFVQAESDIDDQTLAKLSPLLIYRQTISEVSTWPYDGGVISRFGFYLIIPPITWAGAALIENLVDSLL